MYKSKSPTNFQNDFTTTQSISNRYETINKKFSDRDFKSKYDDLIYSTDLLTQNNRLLKNENNENNFVEKSDEKICKKNSNFFTNLTDKKSENQLNNIEINIELNNKKSININNNVIELTIKDINKIDAYLNLKNLEINQTNINLNLLNGFKNEEKISELNQDKGFLIFLLFVCLIF